MSEIKKWYIVQLNSLNMPKLVGLIEDYYKEDFYRPLIIEKIMTKKGKYKLIKRSMFLNYAFLKVNNIENTKICFIELFFKKIRFFKLDNLIYTIPNSEIDRFKNIEKQYQNNFDNIFCDFKKGEIISILVGSFSGFHGKVISVNKNIVKVEIYIFNRLVHVDLDCLSIARIGV